MRDFQKKSAIMGVLVACAVVAAIGLLAWGATLFEDDFEPAHEGWLVGADPQGNALWEFIAGEYQVLMTRPQTVSTSLAPIDRGFSEFCLEIESRITSDTPGEVGLVFGVREENGERRFSTFGIFRDGAYGLARFAQGALEDLPVTTAPLKLRPAGSFNTLRVVAKDGTVQFFGNGQLLATVDREEMEFDPSGEIGLFGGSKAEPFLTGRFAYIRLMTPDCKR